MLRRFRAESRKWGWNAAPSRDYTTRECQRKGIAPPSQPKRILDNYFKPLQVGEPGPDSQGPALPDLDSDSQGSRHRKHRRKRRKIRGQNNRVSGVPKHRLKLGTLNIGGALGDKIHELEDYLAREKYDIVALSETGLDTNQRINVKGYTLHRGVLSARGNARKPRGVAFFGRELPSDFGHQARTNLYRPALDPCQWVQGREEHVHVLGLHASTGCC